MCIAGRQAYVPSLALILLKPISCFMSKPRIAALASTNGQSKKSPEIKEKIKSKNIT